MSSNITYLPLVSEWQPRSCKPALLLQHVDIDIKPVPLTLEHIPFDPTPQITPSASLSILTNFVSQLSNQSLSAIGRKPSRERLCDEIDASSLSLDTPHTLAPSPEPSDTAVPQKKHKFGLGKIKKVLKKISTSRDSSLNKQSSDNLSINAAASRTTTANPSPISRSASMDADMIVSPKVTSQTPVKTSNQSISPEVAATSPIQPAQPLRLPEPTIPTPVTYTIFVCTTHITIYDRVSKERMLKEKFSMKAMRALLIGKSSIDSTVLEF